MQIISDISCIFSIIILIKDSKYIFFVLFHANTSKYIINIWKIIQRKKEYNYLFVKTATNMFIFLNIFY